MKLGGIYVSVSAKTDKLKRDLAKAKTMTQKASLHMKNAIRSISFARIGVAAAAFTAAYVYGMKKAIDAASALQEVQGKFDVVFKDHKIQAEDMAKVLVDAYAMSTREAKQYMSSVQDLLVPMGMASDKALAMSNEVVKLAADLGSFNNLPTKTVMLDIQSALVGNFETMKKYGVILNETVIKQKARDMGLYQGKGLVDANTKALVAYKLMLEGSAAAIGDQERTMGSYANQMKKLKANVEDLKAAIGEKLLPEVVRWVNQLNIMIQNNPQLADQMNDIAVNTLQVAKSFATLVKYAGLRGIGGTIAQGAELAKAGLLDYNEFLEATLFERQKMIDAIYKHETVGALDFDLQEAALNRYKTIIEQTTSVVDSLNKKLATVSLNAMPSMKSLQEPIRSTEKLNELMRTNAEITRFNMELRDMETQRYIDNEAKKIGAFEKWAETSKSVSQIMNDVAITSTEMFANDFVNAIADAETSFKDFARNFLRDIAKMIAKQALLNAMKSVGSSIFNADGNVYDRSGVVPFASGGVVNKPTLFPFSGGTGLMGEAGPEAIMPLKRGPGGKLGVESSGNQQPTTVNNYHIHAIDAKSLVDVMRRTPTAITIPLTEQMQRGNSGLNSTIRKVAG